MGGIRATSSMVLTCAAIVSTLVVGVQQPVQAAPVFDDVVPGSFYEIPVEWMVEQELTTGTSPTTFSPNDPVTRAQFAAFLARYSQEGLGDGGHPFVDVPAGAYYDEAVAWLVDQEITTGTSPSTYSPSDVVTRGQLATFLWRFAGRPDPASLSSFDDIPAGAFYEVAVDWLAAEGITQGTSPTTFSPLDEVTRAQLATFFWRLAGMPEPEAPGLNRMDDDVAAVAEEADVEFVDVDPGGTSTLDWVGGDAPSVGEIIVMGVTEETPEGFLGRVTARSGSRYTTEPAALSDVVPVADFRFEVDIGSDPDEFETSGLFEDLLNLELECGPDDTPFEVSGSLTVDSGVVLEGSWSPWSGASAFVGFEASASVALEVSAAAAVECSETATLARRRFTPITFSIGPVPVVVTPELSLEVDVTGRFAAELSAGWSLEASARAGIAYDDGAWSPSFETEVESGWDAPSLNGVGSATIEAGPRFDVRLYGVTGPYLKFGPFFQLTVQTDDPWWQLSGGLAASVGASFDLWILNAEVEFSRRVLRTFEIARADDASSGGLQQLPPDPPAFASSFRCFLVCSVSELWQIDLGGDVYIGDVRDGSGVTLSDIARTSTGELYGSTFTDLYQIDPATAAAVEIGPMGASGVNALAALSDGRLMAATTDGDILLIDRATGSATTLGSFGGDLVSSGDLVEGIGGRVYATATTGSGGDVLLEIDPDTGTVTQLAVELPEEVFGLVMFGLELYGLTADSPDARCPNGELIRIDPLTDSVTFRRCLGFDAGGAGGGA